MAVGEGLEGGLEIVERIDAIQFSGADQRGDQAPVFSTLVMTSKKIVLSARRDRADRVFYRIVVDLDAAIGEEHLQAVPVVGDVAQLFTEPRSGRDTRPNSSSHVPKAVTMGVERLWRTASRSFAGLPSIPASIS